jgi:D-glycero-D-manno-heptose 1,7-bisphosphate phosphatase
MKVTTGLILCGGTGSRVKKLINSKQKCMHRLYSIPILTYLLDQLSKNGFKKIYFLCHFNHNEISDYFNKNFKNLKLNYIVEKKKLGTGGAIINFFKKTQINCAYIFNGDTVYNFDDNIFNFKKLKKNTIFFKRKDNLHKNSSGNIYFFKDKPQFYEKKNKSNFINTGIYFLKKSIINFKVKQCCSLEKDILEKELFIKDFNFKEVNINFYDIGDKNRIKKSYKIKNLLGSKNSQNAIFLDRDGTLIEENVKYLHKIRDVKFISKTLKFIRKNNSFDKIFIVTNQSGLGRKFYSLKDFYNVSDFIVKKLRNKNIYINGIHFCPHLPSNNCECRKPKHKMLSDIKNSFNINLKKSIMLGNEEKDRLFANFKLNKFYKV